MPKQFLGKRILVITAHPDDETIAAGTMYENYKAGGETYLVCATYGEKGKSHLSRPVSDAALKRIRKNELLAAAKVLHAKKVFFLGLPDTGVREHARSLFEKCLLVARRVKPEQLVSFGPDGGTGHLDHIAVGRAAWKLAKRFKIPLAASTLSGAGVARRRKMIVARRKFGKYSSTFAKHRKGDIKIKIDAEIKLKAMRNHKSQFPTGTPFAHLPRSIVRRFLAEEHFVSEKI